MEKNQKLMLHPIRIRMIQLLAYRKSMTVAELADEMADVPRSTIYRHISLLHENEILTVVKEQKIRGTYEREYALNAAALSAGAEDPQGLQETEDMISCMLLKLFSDFSRYFKSADVSPRDDRLFYSINSLMLSDAEFDSFTEDIFDVVKKYMNLNAAEGRKPRTISFLSSPQFSDEVLTDKEEGRQ